MSCPTYRCLSLAPTFVPLLQMEHSRGVTGGKSLAHGAGWRWIYLGFQSQCCAALHCTRGFSPSPCFWETPQPDEGCSALPLAPLHAKDVSSPFRVAPRARPTRLLVLLIPKINACFCLQAYGPGRPYPLHPPAGRYSWN